jgi:hypothetical protein
MPVTFSKNWISDPSAAAKASVNYSTESFGRFEKEPRKSPGIVFQEFLLTVSMVRLYAI